MVLKAWPTLRRLGLLALAFVLPGAAAPVARISLSTTPLGRIDPRLFGVNYVWHLVPQSDFPAFGAAMRDVAHATLTRYPGGWAAERYDWDRNEQTGEQARAVEPGIGPDAFLAATPRASFVTPSAAAIRDPAEIDQVVQTTAQLVRRFGARVAMWEIGNEWWLQRGAKQDPEMRARNLAAYAALVARVVPAMRQANARIEIYATGEWTHPEDFATLRALVGPAAWDAVTGVSIHPYCGTLEAETLCSLLPQRAREIRAASGKRPIYASEWSLGPRVTSDDYGIRNANQLVTAIRSLAEAGLDAAAYWPPVRAVPAIAFVSAGYGQAFATGRLFGWMSQSFRGEVLRSDGDLPSAAARGEDGVWVVVSSMDAGPRTVEVALEATGLTRLVSAEVMFAANPDDRDRARLVQVAALPAAIHRTADGRASVVFDVNPGTAGRGAAWEIVRLHLR